MCVKLSPENLNPGPCPSNPGPCSPHPTSTYTYGVTTVLRVRSGSCNISNIGLICEMSIKESI